MATNASHSDFKVSPQLHCGTPRKISQGWPDGATENPEVKHENQKPEMNSNNTGTGTGTILAQSHFGLFIYQLMLVHLQVPVNTSVPYNNEVRWANIASQVNSN